MLPVNQARDIFLQALERTGVAAAMERRVTFDAGTMQADGRRYKLDGYERVLLIAIGKAAGSMAASLLRIMGEGAVRMEGVVAGVCTDPMPERIVVFAGGHPSPTQASLDAAAEILRLLEGAAARDLVIFLMSGGGSSIMEQMLDSSISLNGITAIHKALVESGAPIAAINVIRKHLSAVKGGRLAVAAAPAEQLTIFVSDVPPDELDALASGPTVPDRSTVEDVRLMVEKYGLAASLPKAVTQLLLSRTMAETPKPGHVAFARSHWFVLLDSSSLADAAAESATKLGWNVVVDSTCDDWPAEDAAEYLLRRLEELRLEQPRLCLISAGEVTVKVPAESTGHGGRNQHFALLCCERIAGSDRIVLSAGSDGVDGNSPAAGGVVDGTTLARADAMGLSVAQMLTSFNSYELLSKLGDAIMTGPTGNNLRDLRILLAP